MMKNTRTLTHLILGDHLLELIVSWCSLLAIGVILVTLCQLVHLAQWWESWNLTGWFSRELFIKPPPKKKD